MMHSNVVSQIMSKIPSRNRAYSLQQALRMGENCLSLILDHRMHSSVPMEIFRLKNLVALSMENIHMDILPNEIDNLKELKILNLLGTGVEKLSDEFQNLKLEALFISDNNWDEIPNPILNSFYLKSLFIQNSSINKIDEKINNLSFLEELNFSNNLINYFPDEFYELINLKEINFSKNKIKEVKNNICNLEKLKSINFSQNKIDLIPEKINNLSQLNFINFSKNKITKIPNGISDLNLISIIDLNNNKIINLNPSLFPLPISFLDLSNNEIIEIPTSISKCKRLRKLNISSNKIEYIPNEISELKQLQELNLNKNPLNHFPKAILGLDRIKKIRGTNPVIPLEKRKYIIPYINHCKKNNYSFEKRIQLWDIALNIDNCKREQLILLVNSNFRPFKASAIEKLVKPIPTVTDKQIINIYIAGKNKIKKTELTFSLLQQGILFSNRFSEENTHILLGKGKYNSEIPKSWKGHFMTEKELLNHINYKPKENDYTLSQSSIDSIKKLLFSNKQNQELALNLLSNKNIPKELFTVLFFISISDKDSKKRIKAKQLIKSELNKKIINYSIKDFKIEHRINFILNSINHNKINKKELAYLLFNQLNKGWLFIKNNYDTKIINKLNNLNLSNAALESIPEEIKNINSNKINLSQNKLSEINFNDSILLNDFSEIDLSNNPLKEIHPNLLQSEKLRILNLKNCKNITADLIKNKASWITVFI